MSSRSLSIIVGLVAATLAVATAIGVGRDQLVDPGSSRSGTILATVTDGYVIEPGREPVGHPGVISNPQDDAGLRSDFAERGPELPKIDYDRSFLFIALWDSCPHDRAEIRIKDGRLWVQGVEINRLCEAPEWTLSPVVILWSTTGDSFSHLAWDDPSAVVSAVRDREVEPVVKIEPDAQRHGRDESLRSPGPVEPEVFWAEPGGFEELEANPAFPPNGEAVLAATEAPVLLVVTNGCMPAWYLGVAGGEVRILRQHLEWPDCENRTSSALFVLDDQFPSSVDAVGVDYFDTPADIDLET